MEFIYVRTTMTIPNVGTSIHVAELEAVNHQMCAMRRIIELDPGESIQGAGTPAGGYGLAAPPEAIVPHPNTYSDFPDIEAELIDGALFDALWAEAQAKFPEL